MAEEYHVNFLEAAKCECNFCSYYNNNNIFCKARLPQLKEEYISLWYHGIPGYTSVFVLLMFPISETPCKYYHVVANVVFQT